MVFLTSLKCSGLYSYGKQTELEFSNQNLVVGPNNSGKSNLFRIISLFADTFRPYRTLFDWEIHPNTMNPVLEVRLTLRKEEVEKIVDFLSFFVDRQTQSANYYQFKDRDFLLQNLDQIRIRITWFTNIMREGREPIFEVEFEKIGLKLFANSVYGTISVSNKIPKNLNSLPAIENLKLSEFIDKLSESENPRDYVDRTFDAAGDKVLLVDTINPNISQDMPEVGKQIIKKIHEFLGYPLGQNYQIGFFPFLGALLKRSLHYATERRNFAKGIMEYVELLRTGSGD